MNCNKYLPHNENPIPLKELHETAPLVLSMIGDGVHTLFIRAMLFESNLYKNSILHKEVSMQVCANKQAELADKIEPLLTEEEMRIYKKAKNAKVNTVPKNSTLITYKKATAFEAITGYLYLASQTDRLAELYDVIYND